MKRTDLSAIALAVGFICPAAFSQPPKLLPANTSGDGGLAVNAEVDGPWNITVDKSGNLYIYQKKDLHPGIRHIATRMGSIRRVDAATHKIDTVAVECSAKVESQRTSCLDVSINSIAVNSAGKLLVAEFGENRIRSFDPITRKFRLVAGSGGDGDSGDGGPATKAEISPGDLVVDSRGNIVVADFSGSIRRVDARSNKITTIAGGREEARPFFGDGGPALLAHVGLPSALAIDREDNLYIFSDTSERIRRISAVTGIIQTIAGTGKFPSAYDFSGFTGENGPATKAQIQTESLAVDPMGNVYFEMLGRICKVDSVDGTAKTVAGNGVAGFSGDGGPAAKALVDPTSLAVDREGNLFIAEYDNNRIRRIDAKSGIITTYAGNGLPQE